MSPQDIDYFCALIQARSGLVLTGERNFFIETRLAPLARRERMGSVSEVVDQVMEQPTGALARAVVEAMSIQDTAFFRDRAAFGALGALVLPALATAKTDRLRIWSAGCGQGQEPYSLAMLLAEADYALPTVELLATDLSTAALEKGRAGIYTHFEVQRGLPIRRLLRHFEEQDDVWRASPELRQRVRWIRLNLIDPFTVPEGYDLILCRNVVNAFAPAPRAQVLNRLTQALAPGGRLMLGADEAPPEGFVPLPGAPCIYVRHAETAVEIAA